jgi:catechol 2,3-dioxygenase-like lactoylglutathione lyase family enzyme
MGMLFESLDFLYVPTPDIEAAIGYYTGVLGSKLLWKIHAFEMWVACILSDSGPLLLLADHIKKNDMIMIYRVSNLDNTTSILRS